MSEAREPVKFMESIVSAAYDSASLGNTKPGDAGRYIGRGPLQLTGRANYRAAGVALKPWPGISGRISRLTWGRSLPRSG